MKKLPDGWVINLFDECIEKEISANKLKIPQNGFQVEGKYPIIDQGVEYIAGFTDDSSKIYKGELPVIIFGDHTRIFKFVDFPFALGADGTKILVPKKLLHPKYFYFFLKGLIIENHGYSRHYKFLKEKQIIIPPLPTQKKIAAVLEKAEKLREWRKEADGLTDRFLKSTFLEMFGDPVKNHNSWPVKNLDKLCIKIYGGGTPSKSNPEYYIGDIPWVTPKDMKQDFINDSMDHISEKAIEESSTNLIPSNSLLMVIRSGILKKKLPLAVNIREVTINQDMKAFVFDNKATNVNYMFYFFKFYQRTLLNKVRSVTADNLEFNQIKKIPIPLPPIDLQQKFASIVQQVEQVREHQTQSMQHIENLFNVLMQIAFRGELEVK